jgi:hypothetical protein
MMYLQPRTMSGNPWQVRSVIPSNRLPSHHTSQHGNQEPIARLPAPKITSTRWGLTEPLGLTDPGDGLQSRERGAAVSKSTYVRGAQGLLHCGARGACVLGGMRACVHRVRAVLGVLVQSVVLAVFIIYFL